ncbi:pyridoxal 5'-phosphate synthase glutaminase subunit PdxT [Candidatus Nitrososphaera sp. FF02]|uniref:pyridoxal 5'-phosphate synthase glutaminase subunit PdxT n=1 Tax=Candidatus Nitrososphaera sp. FF02 TaxID=3398226 RepID=UPI0039E9ED34
MTLTIGVLGFQGDIEENVAATRQAMDELKMTGRVQLVRYAEDMEKIDALILPGGESTVQSTLAAIQRSLPVLKKRIAEGMPVLGTCAGMIMLSKRVFDRVVGETKQKTIGNLDIVIERNAFGRQNESFETDLKIDMLGKGAFKGVFIRAPAVAEMGKDVEVIARHAGKAVAVRQKNIIGTAFHPELAGDARMHKQIVKMALEQKRKR